MSMLALYAGIVEPLRVIECQRQLMEQLDSERIASEPVHDVQRGGRAVAGGAVVGRALVEWRSHVEEPPGAGWERIGHFIRDRAAADWSWRPPYTQDGQWAWCGCFASWCWAAAGLRHEARQKRLVSTHRLYEWARCTDRWTLPGDIMPGDLVVIGSPDDQWGYHIAVAVEVPSEGRVATVEGNAYGLLPDGSHGEGVVKQVRSLDPGDDPRVLYAVRPLEGDLG